MTIDDLLHETAPDPECLRPHTDTIRTDVLARATRARPRRAGRRLRVGLAAAAVATVGFTGVAYATGAVPPWLPGAVEEFADEQGVPVADRPEMRQVVDLELPDGSRFAAWSGVSDEMWCTAHVDQWDGRGMGTGGTACSDSGPSGFELNRIRIAWAEATDGSTYFPVLFGESQEGAASVRVTGRFAVTGEVVNRSLPVDPVSGAFAVTLPGTDDHPWDYLEDEVGFRASGITIDLLDADGAVLRTIDDLYV